MLRIICYMLMIIPCFFCSRAAAQISCVTADCHQAYKDEIQVHPEENACSECHRGDLDSHVDGAAPLSLAAGMCGACHQDLIKHRYPHPPAAEGACHLCHNPHGDLERKLLPSTYPVGFYEDYGSGSYSLCFSCHKRTLLRFPDTTFATGFRDGKRNLHYTHVNKSHRGRSCKLCHEVHGGDNPKLIAETVHYGEWKMAMNFEKNDDGGSCAPGCHRPLSYSREKAGEE